VHLFRWQVESGWLVAARLGGGGGTVVAVDGLTGVTLVEELLVRAAVMLGVAGEAEVVLRVDSRLLKAEDLLEEAGAVAGGVVEMWLGEWGGMHGTQEDLVGALDTLQGQLSDFISALDLAKPQEQPVAACPSTSQVMFQWQCYAS
jgi:hypothetical protein